MTNTIEAGDATVRPSPANSTKPKWMKLMNDYLWILILVAWFALMKFVLPGLGVPT